MLQSLARLELRDGALIGKLAVALQAAPLADVHPTAVACTANALARLGAGDTRLLRFLAAAALAAPPENFAPEEAAAVLSAYTRLQQPAGPLALHLAHALLARPRGHTLRSASTALHALSRSALAAARGGFVRARVFPHLSAAVRAIPAEDVTPVAAALLWNAHARLDLIDRPLFDHLQAAARGWAPEALAARDAAGGAGWRVTSQTAALHLNAMARFGARDPAALAALAAAAAALPAAAWSAPGVAQSLHALARLHPDFDHPELVQARAPPPPARAHSPPLLAVLAHKGGGGVCRSPSRS